VRELQLKALPIPVNCAVGIDLDALEKSLAKNACRHLRFNSEFS